jgi:DNA-binding MarR family transcriptional regulator
MEISEKEYSVIREISNNHLPDQRTIAKRAGISLGLTNLIIKRLITKGYVKAKQLNRKKIQYLLTPKGFSEKARKSYQFTLKTISLLESFKSRIRNLILEKNKEGINEFVIQGGNEELWAITSMVFNSLENTNIKYHRAITNDDQQKDTLILSFGSAKSENTIDLITYLSSTGIFY